jgi:hypothetical protein
MDAGMIQELVKRRANFPPEKQAMIDELARRYGIGVSQDAFMIPNAGGNAPAPPQYGDQGIQGGELGVDPLQSQRTMPSRFSHDIGSQEMGGGAGMISEGGPRAVGASIGSILGNRAVPGLGGVAGGAVGGMTTALAMQILRGNKQSTGEGLVDQAVSGLGGAMTGLPELAQARYPGAAAGGIIPESASKVKLTLAEKQAAIKTAAQQLEEQTFIEKQMAELENTSKSAALQRGKAALVENQRLQQVDADVKIGQIDEELKKAEAARKALFGEDVKSAQGKFPKADTRVEADRILKQTREAEEAKWRDIAQEHYGNSEHIQSNPINSQIVGQPNGPMPPARMPAPFTAWTDAKRMVTDAVGKFDGPIPQSLQKIMDSPEVVPIMQAESMLSDLKADTRVMFPGDVTKRIRLENIIKGQLQPMIDDAVKSLKFGGEEAFKELQAGRDAWAVKSQIFNRQLARAVAKQVEKGGTVLPIIKNEERVQAYLRQYGETGRKQLSGILFEELKNSPTGMANNEALATRLRQIPDSVRKSVFTSDQNAVLDKLSEPNATIDDAIKEWGKMKVQVEKEIADLNEAVAKAKYDIEVTKIDTPEAQLKDGQRSEYLQRFRAKQLQEQQEQIKELVEQRKQRILTRKAIITGVLSGAVGGSAAYKMGLLSKIFGQ